VIKRIFFIVAAIAIGAVAGSWIKNLPGFVVVVYEKTSYEMRLWIAALLVLIFIFVFLFILWVVRTLLGSAGKVRGWHGSRSWKRSRRKTIEGMLAFTEGRWKKSEDVMVDAAKSSDTKLINYLIAAQAAQHQNAEVRRDAYLRLAHQSEPAAKVAIGLTQAQLQLQQNQLEQALASLTDLRSQNPNHPYVLKLLSRLFEKLQDWEKLLDLLPLLKKHKVFNENDFQRVEDTCVCGLLNRFSVVADIEGLQDRWQKLPSSIRKNKSHIVCYSKHLVAFQQWDEAESLLKPLIKKSPDAEVLSLYGDIESNNAEKQFAFLESWQASAKEAPREVFLTLGKLAYRSQLWGKARHFLERSLQLKPTAQGYLVMARTLEQLGEEIHAADCYQKGLEFIASPSQAFERISLPDGSDDLISADLLPKFQKVEE